MNKKLPRVECWLCGREEIDRGKLWHRHGLCSEQCLKYVENKGLKRPPLSKTLF